MTALTNEIGNCAIHSNRNIVTYNKLTVHMRYFCFLELFPTSYVDWCETLKSLSIL